jgi:hypothetical protein
MKCRNANRLQVSLIWVTYAESMRYLALFPLLLLAACNSGIYTRDGVTDGDTFYLAPSAFANDDPAFQSWVAYSLMKSTCQLELGGENPARASSFDCELTARRHLIGSWDKKHYVNQSITDEYLDAISAVSEAGYLAEYTVYYFGKDTWRLPQGLRTDEFRDWQRIELRRHRPETRLTGSWNYQNRFVKRPN